MANTREKQLLQQAQENPSYSELQYLIDVFEKLYSSAPKLTGGAFIDLLLGFKPKDWDLIGNKDSHEEALLNAGFKLQHLTKTARTYRYKSGMIVQLLSTKPVHFDYTIAAYTLPLNLKNGLLSLSNFDYVSWENRILIPTKHTLNDRAAAAGALLRKPHWEMKGFRLPNETYMSLVRHATKHNNYSS